MSRPTYTVKPKLGPKPGKISGSVPDKRVDQEERLRLTQYSVDHFPESAIWTDMNSRILYVNDATCAMLGYTRDELLVMSVPDIDPNYPRGRFAAFIRSIKECKALTFESGHITKTGRRIPVEVTAHYQKYGDQEYIISFSRDISGRKKIEDALRESEERYRSLVENINDMVWETDLQFTCTYASPKTLDIMGYAPAEVVGKKPFDFICPEDIPRTREALTLAIQGRKPLMLLDYRVRRKDGRVICLETNGEPILGPGGILTGYRGVNRDVTERKEAEEALRKNEQFLSRIFDSFQDGISILDKDLKIVRVNRIMEEWHYFMRPLEGKMCYYAYHMQNKPCEVCPSLRAMRLKTMQSNILPLPDKHGNQVGWLEVYSFPLFDDRGNVTGVIEHVRDITERKKIALALEDEKSRAELYLDLMSHDINNLNQIGIGFLEMLLDSPRLDGREKELLAKSMESLEGSTRLIQNVRKLQQVRSGEMRTQKIAVGQVIDEVKSYYTSTKGGEKIDYAPAYGCAVMANGLLFDVFSNLVGNAIKHSAEKGSPTVSIRSEETVERGKKYCRITVEDNGPGIPDELKDRIFDRLRQGATRAGGKGLGLYLVKSLVESYAGRVWVEDRVPGDHTRGSRFVVMLPAAEQ
ncbi:PAS domain-containing sensor histidine kinase [Methanocella sp. MCL-LM]|uniref:PAS domain-containing protein n=1 Tax=Methanocella sp. MCL-LM TaxID=3412035 RepID=UPI003C720127